MMPGQSLRIPFTRPSENYFACTAHAKRAARRCVEATPDLAVEPAQLAGTTDATLVVLAMRVVRSAIAGIAASHRSGGDRWFPLT